MIDDIKKTLWATADKLRANMDAAEYKHLVLGLIFVKYISDTFQSRREELTRRFADPKDDYFLHDADAALLAEELEDRDYYREVNVFWVPETARWESLRAMRSNPTSANASMMRYQSSKLKTPSSKAYWINAMRVLSYRMANSASWLIWCRKLGLAWMPARP
jgi:type I restriction-modification system DNA methylase subunit